MLLNFDDIKKSFTFAIKEKDFALNLVIGGILYLITGCLQQVMKINKNILENTPEILVVVVIFILISLILNIFTNGYPLVCANNYLHKRKPVMPRWSNISGIMLTGLKATIISILYYIPSLALIAISAMITLLLNQPNLIILLLPVNLVVIITSLFFMFMAMIIFLKRLSITDALDFSLISKILSQYLVDLFLLILVMLGISLLIGLLSFLLCITCVGIILIPFITFYSQLVFANIMAQFYEKIFQPKSQKEEIE